MCGVAGNPSAPVGTDSPFPSVVPTRLPTFGIPRRLGRSHFVTSGPAAHTRTEHVRNGQSVGAPERLSGAGKMATGALRVDGPTGVVWLEALVVVGVGGHCPATRFATRFAAPL